MYFLPESLYIHYPFCRKACNYCGFHFSTNLRPQKDLILAIVREIKLIQSYSLLRGPARLRTLYFGGGTPSVMDYKNFHFLLEELNKIYCFNDLEEFTIEVNPEDVSAKSLDFWSSLGVNRISLGVQSFNSIFLREMNRNHSLETTFYALDVLKNDHRFKLSLDLIYGFPNQTFDQFCLDLNYIFNYKPHHFSAYQLTIEPGTALDYQVKNKTVTLLNEDLVADMMQYLYSISSTNGYHSYELSNFSLDDNVSKHNSFYWTSSAYLGLGPSAHSFDGKYLRFKNVSNNIKYIECVNEGKLPRELEWLTPKDRFNEFIMLGLRQSSGIDLNRLKCDFDSSLSSNLLFKMKQLNSNWFVHDNFDLNNRFIILSHSGRTMADYISAYLFID